MTADIEHPVVESFQPPDENMKIWRYIDLPKLIDFLETGSLHFARVDTLDDPYEGALTRLNAIAEEQQIQAISIERNIDVEELRRTFTIPPVVGRQAIYVNCWHGGETESAAMWKLYGTAAGSIAIQSTYKKLVDALPDDVFMGMVQYKNYHSLEDWIPGGNLMHPFIHKRMEFEHEKEVRAFIWVVSSDSHHRIQKWDDRPRGLKVDIDIDTVVETIRVQPTTPAWERESIKKLLDRYDWGTKVMPSQIDIEPMY